MGINCVGNETLEEYKVKIETIVRQLLTGEKHLVIWGAGENGERFKEYCDTIQIPVLCFVDNNPELWGSQRYSLSIISPADLGQRNDIVVLISFPYPQVVEEIVSQIENMPDEKGKRLPYFDRNLYFLLQNLVYNRKDTVAEIIISMYKSVYDIEYLNMPVLHSGILTTRCNLKCRDCSLKIPYLKEHKDRPLKSVLSDIERSLEIVDSITEMDVCGGETFLYHDLIPFLNKVKRYRTIFHISITTNGTIVPDDNVFDAMQNSNLTLRISNYGDISKQKYVLEQKCRERHIPCFVQDCSWFDISPVKELAYSKEELQKMFNHCTFKYDCTRNWDGVIYRCGFQRVWGNTDPFYDTEQIKKDGVDLKDRTDDQALKQRLRAYLTTTVPFEICKYCTSNTRLVPRAIQL